MSVIGLCPQCGVATPFHQPPVASCPHCNADFPGAVTAPAERALAAERTPKPFLLQLGMLGSLLFGAIVALLLVLAPFDLGSYSISGEPVSGPEFVRRAGLFVGGTGIIMLAIGFGLWLEREWTRTLMVGYWGAMAVAGAAGAVTGSFTVDEAAGLIVQSLLALAIACWYLYWKANVVAYYRWLERASERARVGSGSDSQARDV